MRHRWFEWVAFAVGLVLAALFLVPWDLVLAAWWGPLVFLTWPAFIWLVSR